jgi:tetratricopeptide (TPR) repeat protein
MSYLNKMMPSKYLAGIMPSNTRKEGKKTFAQAMALYRVKAYSQAVKILETMIGANGLDGHLVKFYHARACRLEAERLCSEKKYLDASQWLRRAMTYCPRSTKLIDFLAKCYVKQGSYDQAAETYHQLAELTPAQGHESLREAMSYFLAGHANKAIELLHEKIRQEPSSYDLNYVLGMILAAEDQPRRAVPFLTKACQMRPESIDAQWKLGLAYGLCGQLIEAIHHLKIAHRLEPANHWLLAQLSLAVGHARSQGIEIDLEPIAISEAEAPLHQQSLDQLADLIVRDSEFVTAFLELPCSDIDPQIFSSLLEIMMRAMERHPEYADLHYHCSCVYERLGQADNAIHESEHALAINPRYINAMIHLAKLYMQTNRNEEAITRLQEAIAHGANYADVHYLLGNLYHGQGALDDAKRHYKEALKINRNFRAAEDALTLMAV